uniref:Tyrosinase copper-binding domain-containing protein n=1 Tax=Rhizochromulina marina TaxID=1034831 RepID=A0A7S2W1K8_9STRA|mmetsp:Transcript_10907/g.31299  ORF Transcript_10907/g.31299 Transcript_10907/m.31299 type:complete len:643 (+) Transcript_10907:24-1952(+)
MAEKRGLLDESLPASPHRTKLGVVAVASLTVLLLVGASLRSPERHQSAALSSSVPVESSSLTLDFQDDYSKTSGRVYHDYDFMKGIDGGIVAAHLVTSIRVVSDPLCSPKERCDYTFTVDDVAVEPSASDAAAADFTFTELKAFTVSVTSSSGASVSTQVMCRYIRRELRSLNPSDRQAYFDAVATVYTVHTLEGEKLYGKSYKDAGYFINYHTWMAGERGCDHLHDGMGFLTGHNAISMEFERVLHTVNPAVIIPYWDYTIDMHQVKEADEDMAVFYDSPVFRDDWFGPMGKKEDDFVVTSGAASAYLSVDPDFWQIPETERKVVNGFGLMRSPWNVADIPYLLRSNKTFGFYSGYSSGPKCGEFYSAMKYDDLYTFTKFAQANCHGSIHTIIGGVFNSNYRHWAKMHNWKEKYAEAAGLQAFGVLKGLWRSEYSECPSSCSYDSSIYDCACVCTGTAMDMTDVELEHFITKFANSIEFEDDKHLEKEFAKLVCGQDEKYSVPFLGDAMNSGATADPSFWPTHPNIDRLFQWRRLQGLSSVDTWMESGASSSNYWGSGSDAECWGHNPDDVMIWRSLFLGDEDDDSFYTAKELFTKMDPHLGTLTYVFDRFEWPHCAEEGYPLDLIGNSTSDDDAGSWQTS